MKSLSPSLFPFFAFLLLYSSCGQTGKNKEAASDPTSPDAEVVEATHHDVSDWEIESELSKRQAAFKFQSDFEDDMGTIYVVLSADIQWPEKIGNANISVLQDSIVAKAFPLHKGKKFQQARKDFLADYGALEIQADVSPIPFSQLPADSVRWNNSVTVRALETNFNYATYLIMGDVYSGGAHGMMWVDGITVALPSGQPVTLKSLFKPGSEAKLADIITNNLAEANNVSPATLTDAGYDAGPYPVPNVMYLNNGAIVFHYGSYEIACYARGMTDVRVYPYQVADLLTPFGRKLFADQLP